MKLDKVKAFCRPYLSSIHRKGTFVYYTSHDESHSAEVWKYAKELTSGRFTKYEMLLLEASCWCHDIGLSKWKREDIQFNNPEYCNFVRKNHHKRSEEFVNKYYHKMGIEKNEAFLIGRICYGHSSKTDINELKDENYIYVNERREKVRTKLLSSILRIADALDAREDRLPASFYREDAPFESKIEYMKHAIVKGVDIKRGNLCIELIEYPEFEFIVESVKKKLKEEFESVNNVLKTVVDFKFTKGDIRELKKLEEELGFIPEDVKRIMEIYVKPSNFDEILDKLEKHNVVIITGDANVGKTSTAHYIAGHYWIEKKGYIFLDDKRVQTPENFTIVCDDAFGKSKFEDRDYYISPEDIIRLKEKNHVIVTSREQILNDAVRKTRFGEYDYENWIVKIEQEGCYKNDDLKKILSKHIELYKKRRQDQR